MEEDHAALAYMQFLLEHPDELAVLELWESAPLVDTIEPREP